MSKAKDKRTVGDSSEGSRTVTSSCSYDCGARCVLKVTVDGGRVEKIATEKESTDGGKALELRACMRGLVQREVLYSPDRLKTPLIRTGPRGSGEFREASWEEALELVASEIKSVIAKGDPRAFFLMNYHACEGALSSSFGGAANHFFDLLGGCTSITGNTSFETASFASRVTLGSEDTGSTPDNLLKSELILLWGWNPLVSRFRPYTWGYLSEAKKRGVKIVCVDPRHSPTAKALADEWLPIAPGGDTALLLALCQVIIEEGLYDESYVSTYVEGFEHFRAHLNGEADGVAKTPEWAESITGIPADKARALAREFGEASPAALCAGWAPGRTAFGEQFHRAAMGLSAITGNIGVEGGNVGGGTDRMPLGKAMTPPWPEPVNRTPRVHFADLHDLLLKGKEGGFEADIELVYLVGSNALNQFPNANKGVRAFSRPRFIVAHELFLTPTARHADVVLPVSHFLEREDIASPWMGGPYNIHMDKAVDPPEGALSDAEVFARLACLLGLEGFDERGHEERFEEAVGSILGLGSVAELREKGVHLQRLDRPHVAFRAQIEEPGDNPFKTPSGKIELYSAELAKLDDPLLPPLPSYMASDPPPDYPLRLITPHAKTRVNSQLDNVPAMKSKADDSLWLNPADAASRGVGEGDAVLVTSAVGSVRVKVKVTDAIMQGVVSLDAGAWYKPGADGVDEGGCVNTLTPDVKSPAGALVANNCFVEVSPA